MLIRRSLPGAGIDSATDAATDARALARGSIGRDQLRRSLPALLGIPLGCGLLAGVGIRAGFWSGVPALAAFTLVTMAALAAFALRHARRIDAIVRERNRLEGLFRRTFEHAAVGMGLLDAIGRWLWVNDRLCEILGWPREELLRRSLRDLSHPDEPSAGLALHEAMERDGVESQTFVRRCVSKQGHELWVDLVVSAERGAEGEIAYLVAVVQDVSERKRTEMELELAQRALVCSSDGVIIASAHRSEGEIVYVNPAFSRITGYPAQEVLGKGWAFLGELGRGEPPLDEVCRRLQREESASVLLRGHRKDGGLLWSEIRLAPVVDSQTGLVTHHVGIQEDVTERLGAVAERERLLGEALAARADSERAGRAKDDFFALVSHELRSPLSAITSWLPMLRRASRPEVHAQAVKVIERSAQLLTRLIGDLLDASRMASGKLEIERASLDLLERIQTAVDGFGPAACERGVSLALHASERHAFIEGDAERIDQIVRNLIENALKFTPPDGRIDVDLERRGDEIEVRITDTGEGIPPELLPQVFERFRQGDSGPRGAAKGLGLGLAIVRHLVELHGGRVGAESEGAGKGTRIRLVLPAAPAPRRLAPQRASEAPGSLDGVCVLLLDPDRFAAEALGFALEEGGSEVVWVRNAGAALERAESLKPQVVVASVDLLPGDAEVLLDRMRCPEGSATRAVIGVALSTDDTPSRRRRAREMGFDAFLARPFDPVRLVGLIRSSLARSRRCLIVDDDRDAADSLAVLLARRGFEVDRAYGAVAALQIARSFRPSVVLTDLQLDGAEGADLARTLRAETEAIRVIAVTGRSRDSLGSEADLFDGFLRKPIQLETLLSLLREP